MEPLSNAPESTWLGTVRSGPVNTVFTESDGDLWPSCWATDDVVYTAWGDGHGFDRGAGFVDIGTARIVGGLESLRGENRAKADEVCQLWTAPGYTRKPTGIVCVGNRLHLAVQDLAWDFRDAPAATVCTSEDGGATWTWDRTGPMFDGHVFTTIWFADLGRGGALASDGDGYVYAFGLDGNWRASHGAVPDPVDVFLARVPRDDVADRAAWEFHCGDGLTRPAWTGSIGDRTPVLHDDRRVYSRGFAAAPAPGATVIAQGGVLYDRALDRFLYISWAEWVHVLYESPTPWGPWRRAFVKDYTGHNDLGVQYGGYGTSFPSKFVSLDGRTLMLQSNRCCGIPDPVPSYSFSMRPVELAVRQPEPAARAATDHLADLARAPGAVLVGKSTRQGSFAPLVDDDPDSSVDDDDGDAKDVSWWGVRWHEPRRVSSVTFTTGPCAESGGWFVSVPRVELLGDEWREARGQVIDRQFVVGRGGAREPYTIDFAPEECYGVRIVGAAGGDRRYTSLSAFGAHLSPAVVRDPGFEQCREPWGVWRFEGGAPRQIVRDPERSHGGLGCALLCPEPAPGRHRVAQTVALSPGQRLEVAAWVRAEGGVATVHVGLRLAGADHVSQAVPRDSAGYQRVRHELTVPADCTDGDVVVGMDADSDGARLYVDDVSIQPVPDQSKGLLHA